MRGALAGGVIIGFFFTGTSFFILWAVVPSFLLQDAKKKKTRNFLRRQDFGKREKRKEEGARRGGRFLLRVTISRFLPLKVLKSKITQLDLKQYSFRVLSLKKKCQEVLELAPCKEKNSLGPRP